MTKRRPIDDDANPARSLGGRFSEPADELLQEINRSVDVDRRMWRQDIAGSRAHAIMLGQQGLLRPADVEAILAGLERVGEELREQRFAFLDLDEDIHMAIERRLTELAGEPATRLHTGRSRNDQVMTDVLLWLRDELGTLRSKLCRFGLALVERAGEHRLVPMPSFTHSQPAQVSSVAHWLLSHAAEAERNLRRLDDLAARLDECPLGAGASAGSYLPLDRDATAAALGFSKHAPNSVSATGGRADLLDALALLAIIGVGLSRLGEELVLFASPAYGFVALPDRLTTGSSLLPHKRNPDGAELLRAGGKLATHEFAALASVCSGLVQGYSKDLQFDKELLFRAWDRSVDLLRLASRHVEAVSFLRERLAAACGPELAALWLADRLVTLGLPFRRAHRLVGLAARRAIDGDTDLAAGLVRAVDDPDCGLDDEIGRLVREACPELREQLAALDADALLAGLASQGSAAPDSTLAQAETLRARFASSID